MKESLTRSELERFRSLVEARLGLQFDDDRIDTLRDVLRERMSETGQTRFDAYERTRLAGPARGEVRLLAGRLTVPETYFFRYWDHFRAFLEVVLPERAKGISQGGRRLRVLSAGCASGEELYTLAILLREHLPERDAWEIVLRGVDVNTDALERATRGRYTIWSLRETSAEVRDRYFQADGRDFELDERVRAMAAFEERNLTDPDPTFWKPNAFDVVFCRNVTMYFTPEAARGVVDRIARSLTPGGFLFLGHAETLRGISQAFHLRHTHDAFYYQLRESSQEPSSVEPGIAPFVRSVGEPSVLSSDTSWVDAIGRSADRIEQLSRPRPSDAPVRVVAPSSRQRARHSAMELMRQERFAAAIEALPDPAADPDDVETLLLRAVLLVNGGDVAAAEVACRDLLGRDELNAGGHYLAALCREHAGDRDGSLSHARTACYLDESFAMPHLHIGLLCRRSGDVDTASAELGRALSLLAREDSSRILLFGGGFGREQLVELCRAELRMAKGVP